MRSTLLILATVLLLGGAFAAYWFWQPASALLGVGGKPNSQALRAQPGNLIFGPGDDVVLRSYDKATGRLVNRFQASDYRPQPDGNIRVTRPRVEFYLRDGQVVRVTGDDGTIFVPEGPQADSSMTTGASSAKTASKAAKAAQPPTRGRLNNVRIELLADAADARASLTIDVNNIAFDNENFLISTGPIIDPVTLETRVAPDQVPVRVRGNDYDFDGRGLTIRWNDRDHRLEWLEIAHGERLVVKNSGALTGHLPVNPKSADEPDAQTRVPLHRSFASLFLRRPVHLGAALVAPIPALVPAAAAGLQHAQTVPTTQPKPRREQPPYRASFVDAVRVVQDGRTLAVGDLLQIDFRMEEPGEPPADAPTTGPTTAPTTQPQTQPATPPPPPTRPTSAPATAPTTSPAKPRAADAGFIYLYWTGKLRITPERPSPEAPVAVGQSIVTLVGKPVVLNHDAGNAHCAALVYRSAEGSATLLASPEVPQVILRRYHAADAARTGPAEATIFTERVDYTPGTRLVVLSGRSWAELPMDAGGADGPTTRPAAELAERLDASWTGAGKLFLAAASGTPADAAAGERNAAIERLELAGDVSVTHPQLTLRSQNLAVSFGPSQAPSAKADRGGRGSEVQRIVASDNVYCELRDDVKPQADDALAAAPARTVRCQRLDLAMALAPDGRPYPRIVDATGSESAQVRAVEEGQTLDADRVRLTLAPDLRPAKLATDADAVAVPTTGPSKVSGAAAVEVRSMLAQGSVKVASPDGAVATASELRVAMKKAAAKSKGAKPAASQVVLLGAAGRPARVVDARGNVLTGPKIIVDPESRKARVVGQGTLHALRESLESDGAAAKAPRTTAGPVEPREPQWIDVAWDGGATVDGPADRVDVHGGVLVTSADPDGTVHTATSRKIRITLAPKPPSDKPAAAPAAVADAVASADEGAAAPSPATRPVKAAKRSVSAVDVDVFKGKQVSTILLEDDVVLTSRLSDAEGLVLREFRLGAPVVRYDVIRGKLVVPAAGKMIVRDHRPPAAAGADDEVADAGGGMGNSRGATAFWWNEGLDYSQLDRRATMSGAVKIAHLPDSAGDAESESPEEPVIRLDADRVVAEFEPVPLKAAAATAPPAGPFGTRAPSHQLKRVTASGGVIIVRAGTELLAGQVRYDPATRWIVASGTDRSPAVITQPGGADSTSAEEIWWNTDTWKFKFKNATARVRGR